MRHWENKEQRNNNFQFFSGNFSAMRRYKALPYASIAKALRLAWQKNYSLKESEFIISLFLNQEIFTVLLE